ncbi:uncharacterized protein N7459_001452 [Penicillium hispanicum]|uniref:uncharacterized protein n=1 Tax=Penicillium hispanicum TaxID=1080232 RepID=UPI002541863C|nr:uncharacterized protein N7459_001452 [Penicillium hispanicum]KAJ5595244.1 hypothetical protein N7459_001452 [Penicillium hispanicum]
MSTKGSVLITGCSDGGIGSGLALVFQERGYHVFATARNQEKMAALKPLPNVTLLTLDVTNKEHIQEAAKAVSAQTGGTLSYLINNAGRNHFVPILDDDVEAAKKIFDINVWGPFTVTQVFAPLLIKAQGMLVNITSIAGHGPVPTLGKRLLSVSSVRKDPIIDLHPAIPGSYGASKRAQEQIAEVLRIELAPFKVKALSVVTGAVSTNGQTYFEDWALPEGSLYKAVEPTMRAIAQATDGRGRMPLMTYANQVVDNILNGVTGRIWVGEHAEAAKNRPTEGEGAALVDQYTMQVADLQKLSV